MELTAIEKKYFQITEIWKDLCELHNTLLDLTCQEYSLLLANNLEDFNNVVDQKKEILDQVSVLELSRQRIIDEINAITDTKITKVSELLEVMSTVKMEVEGKHLFRFNALLIDIIEKIQHQNKRNQLFIQKALHNLKEISDQCFGKKSYQTYNPSGKTITRSISS